MHLSVVQDVPQFGPLALTMGGQMVNDPLFVPEILKHVGPVAFMDWFDLLFVICCDLLA